MSGDLKNERLPKSPTTSREHAESIREEEQTFWKSMFGIAIFAVVVFFTMNPLTRHFFKDRYENKAVETLKSIGSSQLAYQVMNNEKFYGSFTALQTDLFFEPTDSLDSLIEGYSLDWSVTNPSSCMGLSAGIGNNTFTIIAKPNNKTLAQLRTFAISEDQVVRMYNPVSGNAQASLSSWDPVL